MHWSLASRDKGTIGGLHQNSPRCTARSATPQPSARLDPRHAVAVGVNVFWRTPSRRGWGRGVSADSRRPHLQDFLDHTAMSEKFAPPKVAIRRYPASRISDVVVVVRGQEMVVRCPSYSQAVKWARLECKSYKIPEPDTDFADNEEPGDVPRPGCAKREEEWGAEGERGNESGEIARARRNSGAAASARSQASARSAAVRHSAANREISCANSCSERPGIRAIAQRAKGARSYLAALNSWT